MNPSGSSPSSEVSEQELVRRKDFLEFGDADVSNLAEINELAQSYADAVIEDFYSPEIAQTMVTLGIDLGRMTTVGDLQSGIERAEEILG